ncbi:acetyl-CoA carboxylase biotin carboxyl carrier protein [bacterium]
MDVQRIENLFDLLKDTDIKEVCWEKEGTKLRLKRKKGDLSEIPKEIIVSKEETKVSETAEEKEQAVQILDSDTEILKSKMIGTFYIINPNTGKPFVNEGDTVKKGQKIGIVEAMRIMKEVVCEYNGTINKILVEDSAPVEYGQDMFLIKKA